MKRSVRNSNRIIKRGRSESSIVSQQTASEDGSKSGLSKMRDIKA